MSLIETGYSGTTAGNLEKAVSRAQEQQFDVYVVNSKFPLKTRHKNEDGACLQFYDRIKDDYEGNINFVVSSRGEDLELEKECNERGIKFINFGENIIPDPYKVLEFVEYLKGLQ